MSLALQQRTAAAAAAALGEPVEPAAAADWGGGLAGMGSCWGDDGDDTTAKLQEVRVSTERVKTCMLARIRPVGIVAHCRNHRGMHRWRMEQVECVCVWGGAGVKGIAWSCLGSPWSLLLL
jgi:hypothetical protein